ncbi:MAG: hypothetical protein ACI836_000630 [Saprospiraceae bacterium]
MPVANGSSRVRAWMLSQGKQKRDGRLTVVPSLNNNCKSYALNSLVYYSFDPDIINDNLKDEVCHLNKIQDNNKLFNLGCNKIEVAPCKRSIALRNVKRLENERKKPHPHTRNKSIIFDGRTPHRTSRVCDTLKEQKEYSYCVNNRCSVCDK